MMPLMTRLRQAIHTFVSKERKLYHNYSMSPMPQKLIANYSIRGLAVPRAGDRSFLTGSIHGGSRSHLIYTEAHPGFGKGGAQPGLWREAATIICSRNYRLILSMWALSPHWCGFSASQLNYNVTI